MCSRLADGHGRVCSRLADGMAGCAAGLQMARGNNSAAKCKGRREGVEKIMKKFKLYFDKEKEEAWLNGMCSRGLAMTKFFLGFYTFAPCEPGAYTYQVDMPPASRKFFGWWGRKREYVSFVEGTGAEYVCSWGFWVIFRKESAKGEFKLYTDIESRILLYQRVRLLFLVLGLYDFVVSLLDTYNVWNYAREFLLEKGSLPEFGGSPVVIPGLALMYLITLAMLTMAARFTVKIRRLKQEKIFS